MAEAKQKWESKLSRQSTTLEQAVEAYKLRYGRSPPKGFDAWWSFAKSNDVVIVDDYDQIHTSITPFLALNPLLLGSRLAKVLANEIYSSELRIQRSRPFEASGERGDSWRAQSMVQLLEGFRRYLPKDFGEGEGFLGEVGGDGGVVRMSLFDHDLGGRVMGEDFVERMMDLATRGEYVEEDELQAMENVHHRPKDPLRRGLLQACSSESLAERKPASKKDVFGDEAANASVSFIRDHLKSFDFCHNPSLIPYHGAYSNDHPRDPTLNPQFVLSKFLHSNQILVTPLDAFSEYSPTVPWDEKKINQILWRGSTTGDEFSNRTNWRNSHRIRLYSVTNTIEGNVDVLVESRNHFWSRTEVSRKRFDVRDLNGHLFNVGISNVIQCTEEDGTCEEMDEEIELADDLYPEDAAMYRYALDIDGNGWSSRFRSLLNMGQVVFKITIFPEWNTEWLTPWLHYVPVNLDLSDLYHSSTFFLGIPGVSDGNFELGKQISEAGLQFVDKHWRWEDMEAYMFRLLLEYRRAMAHDRDAMSMGGRMLL
ncbi:hypothetical protein BDY24DRAFT_398543 [Mrakia frigida]|uniref:uncharacterized protein n=1 Tax=Mrakia frigida TaxID=29902 RepID=UPI003FCC1F91